MKEQGKKELNITNNFNQKPSYKDGLIHMPKEQYKKVHERRKDNNTFPKGLI